LLAPSYSTVMGRIGVCWDYFQACSSSSPQSEETSKPRLRGNQGLWLGEVQQHHIRTLLHSFEDDFTAIWRDVEVANVEVGERNESNCRSVAGLHVDQPKILMLNLSSQKHERPSSAQEGQVVELRRVRVRAGRGRANGLGP